MDRAFAAPFVALAFMVGAVVGSFLNVVIHRLPRDESLVSPGSHCPGCGRAVRPWENVPLLSYLWLRGRCAGCGVRIPLRYPAVECATGLLFAAIVWRHGLGPMTPLWLASVTAAPRYARHLRFPFGRRRGKVRVGGEAGPRRPAPSSSPSCVQRRSVLEVPRIFQRWSWSP